MLIYWPSYVTPNLIRCYPQLYYYYNCLLEAKPFYSDNPILTQKIIKDVLIGILVHPRFF